MCRALPPSTSTFCAAAIANPRGRLVFGCPHPEASACPDVNSKSSPYFYTADRIKNQEILLVYIIIFY
jgi:hypothetical protein